ncbi:MAG: hypothetical protein ABW208_01740 [Pyrinomonadaceae bacterium]
MFRRSHFFTSTCGLLLVVCVVQTHAGVNVLAKSGRSTLVAGSRPGPSAVLREHFARCSKELVTRRITAIYGAVFAADAEKVSLPSQCYFRTEGEVQLFQQRAGVVAATVGRVRVELQPRAAAALQAAQQELRRQNLRLTVHGISPGRRSYEDTVRLWRVHAQKGLNHWITSGRLTQRDAETLGRLSPTQQVAKVLAWESGGLYFGEGFKQPILKSVAPPGASQHNLMLALDVVQHQDLRVRAALAKHGWFQTIRNDEAHFTYLGLSEAELPARGLKRINAGGRDFWLFNSQSVFAAPANAAGGRGAGGEAASLALAPGQRAPRDNETAFTSPAPAGDELEDLPVTMSSGVEITPTMVEPLREMAKLYLQRARKKLHITSGRRSPRRQARAMFGLLERKGVAYTRKLYRGGADPVIEAYLKGGTPEQQIAAMTVAIRKQLRQRANLYKHVSENAVDIRATANLKILRGVARDTGGRVGNEGDHFHFQLSA